MKLLMLASLLLATSSAGAADIQCTGTVNELLVYADGSVNITTSYRNSFTVVCNLVTTRKGVDPFVCAVWAGEIETARKLNQPIHVYYVDDGTGTMTCANIPFYGDAPAPVFLGH